MDKDGNRSLKLNASFGTGSKLKKLLNVGKKITNNVTKTLKQAQQALSKVIDKTISRVSKVSTGNIKGTTVVKVKNKSTSINKALAPIKRTIVALKCPKKEKKAWYEEAWDGVKSFGKDVWNGLTGAASWIWPKVCDAGSFLIQGAQQILSMIDDVLDVVAFGAAVAVFAAGVIALGTSIASTIPALATKVVLGHAIGAIGGYSTGFALFTGKIAIGASGAQIISGASGYGLDFKKISKGEAKSRVANGIRNLSITYVGLESVMVSELIKGEFGEGGGQGSNNQEESSEPIVTADDIEFSDKFKLKDYENQVAQRGWTKQQIADAINNPYKVADSVNKFTGNPAKVYYIDDVHYVVIDTVTRKVVQISNLAENDWKFTPENFIK